MNKKELFRGKVILYSYFAEKMWGYIDEKPNILSVKQAESLLARFRVPDVLKPIVIKEMIEMGLLEKVSSRCYRYKLKLISKEKINPNISKLYHKEGLW